MQNNIFQVKAPRKGLTHEAPMDEQGTTQGNELIWASIPYINGIARALARQPHKLKWFIKQHPSVELPRLKDCIRHDTRTGVIYQR